jgi:putative transposase
MAVLISLLDMLRGVARSRAALHLEVLALRHQLQVLQRSRPRRLHIAKADRWLWAWLSRSWSAWRTALVIVQPETVIAWHRQAFCLFWTWKSRRRIGRPPVPTDVRALIRTMSHANPLWAAPRIPGELLKLGMDVSQATVAKYMGRRGRGTPPSQSWRTFLTNHVQQIATADFFVVPTVTFRLLFVLVILAHERRRVVHVGVTDRPTAVWTAQQLREAFPWDHAPRYLIHDRDSAFRGWTTTVGASGIEEVLTAVRSPWQNAHAERLIGSIRRECLDHVLVVNERGLRRVLRAYVEYYLKSRTHLSLAKDAPISRAVAPPGDGEIVAIPQVGGLHHRYERRAA